MAKYKLRALQRIRNYLSTEKARLLATAFIKSQFYYALLIWMFAGKTVISKLRKIPFRTLQVEIDLTYATSFYSEHICIRCYYLYYLILLGLVSIYYFVN